jgi:hypothetical protein
VLARLQDGPSDTCLPVSRACLISLLPHWLGRHMETLLYWERLGLIYLFFKLTLCYYISYHYITDYLKIFKLIINMISRSFSMWVRDLGAVWFWVGVLCEAAAVLTGLKDLFPGWLTGPHWLWGRGPTSSSCVPFCRAPWLSSCHHSQLPNQDRMKI